MHEIPVHELVIAMSKQKKITAMSKEYNTKACIGLGERRSNGRKPNQCKLHENFAFAGTITWDLLADDSTVLTITETIIEVSDDVDLLAVYVSDISGD